MANRFRGFGRMLSTAKNTTRKEGFAPPIDYVSERMKQIVGDNYRELTFAQQKEAITKRVNKRVDNEMIKAISAGATFCLALSALYTCILFGWYPFKIGKEEEDK
ncbi:uncharacterized protein LOC113356089 isoform X2 [Papaver somniferum]|uniref:uncharacterized protein LOC113356089 isoform X2 n=1 Tax=Papaver somniferum TaxID=3469 RepID=UPI000E7047EE|nr:uncharacterized protein LOC113356089 isoform X2 [Papaver somniferum]